MNLPQVYMCSHPEPSSLLPPHTLPLGRPSAPAPSIPYSASNLDWRHVSYMILYMFQCHSPKSSHPLPLPQSPKDCSVHQCLFCYTFPKLLLTPGSCFWSFLSLARSSLVAQSVQSLPTMWESQVQSLGQEDPLEKEMVTHCSILAWRIPQTEEPGRLQSMGSQRVRQD